MVLLALQSNDEIGHLQQRIEAAARQARKRLQSNISNFEKQMDGSVEGERLAKEADLLMANVHR